MIIVLMLTACMSWKCDAYTQEVWAPVDGYGVADALQECRNQRDEILAARRLLGKKTNLGEVYCDIRPE